MLLLVVTRLVLERLDLIGRIKHFMTAITLGLLICISTNWLAIPRTMMFAISVFPSAV